MKLFIALKSFEYLHRSPKFNCCVQLGCSLNFLIMQKIFQSNLVRQAPSRDLIYVANFAGIIEW